MDDIIANQIDSYRTRLASLDKPEHKIIWENQPPLLFTETMEEIRPAIADLAETAARQSVSITGHAVNKAKEEKELETAAFSLGRAVAMCARKTGNLVLAAKYQMHITDWRRLRDEELSQRAGLLHGDAAALLAGPDAVIAGKCGITAEAVAGLKKEADDFKACIAAPQDAKADRGVLTKLLPAKSRAIAALFADLEDLLPQFGGTPAGQEFIAAYQISARIIDRGHGPGPAPQEPPAPAP